MIPQTGIGRFLFFLLIALIAAQWLVPLAAMSFLPDQVPVHFDFQGHPDRFASKTGWEFWITPMIGTLMGALIMVLMRYPGAYNVPRRAEIAGLPESHRRYLHDLMREMLLAIFVIVQALMLTVIGAIIAFARAETFAFPWAVIMTCVVAPIAVLIVYLVRISRAVDAAKREAGIS